MSSGFPDKPDSIRALTIQSPRSVFLANPVLGSDQRDNFKAGCPGLFSVEL